MTILKNIGITVVVALVTVVASIGFFAPSDSNVPSGSGNEVGSSVNTNIDSYANGVGIGDLVVFNKQGTLGVGVNQASWRNTIQRDVFIDLAYLTTSGTASSTALLLVGTSTAATIADYTAPTPGFFSLINFALATSSTATTTNSLHGSGAQSGLVKIAPGEYLNIAILPGVRGTTPAGCAPGSASCESATSTNRGYTLDYRFRGSYKK